MSQQIGTARPALVGRVAELEHARLGVQAALDGHGLVVLIRGEAGIGKTRLAEELADRAAATGITVALVTCSATTGPLWVWRRVLHALGLGSLPKGAEPDEDPDQTRLRVFSQVADRLGSTPGPVLVVIDDLHLADTTSVQLLNVLGDELRHRSVAVLAGVRTPGPTSPWLADVARRAVVVPLARLADDTGRAAPRRWVAAPVD